mmetsp:Transcript_35185/g.81354  ORF Transcript_35185/g.81354 Transcript_35185/m.81354 type:complete len:109 (+) Transcript_35185:1350-1676(+)
MQTLRNIVSSYCISFLLFYIFGKRRRRRLWASADRGSRAQANIRARRRRSQREKDGRASSSDGITCANEVSTKLKYRKCNRKYAFTSLENFETRLETKNEDCLLWQTK